MSENSKLRERLAANARRVKRVAAANYMSGFGPLLAGICDRFAIHWGDEVEVELWTWIQAHMPIGGPYVDQRAYTDGPEGDLPVVLADLVTRHGLSGWFDIVSGLGARDLAISVEADAIALVVPHLRAHAEGGFDDTVIVGRARTFALMVHHEGTVDVWTLAAANP